MKDSNGLTPKQAAFAREYLVDKNGAQAAIRAGYSKRGAHVTGSQLLAKPNIRAVVKAGLGGMAQQAEVTANAVIHELAKIGFAAIKVGDIKPSDKLTALTRLGEHLGLFDDGVPFIPPAGQGAGDGTTLFQQFSVLNITQEEALRVYQQVIRNTHTRRAEQAKPVKAQRVR